MVFNRPDISPHFALPLPLAGAWADLRWLPLPRPPLSIRPHIRHPMNPHEAAWPPRPVSQPRPRRSDAADAAPGCRRFQGWLLSCLPLGPPRLCLPLPLPWKSLRSPLLPGTPLPPELLGSVPGGLRGHLVTSHRFLLAPGPLPASPLCTADGAAGVTGSEGPPHPPARPPACAAPLERGLTALHAKGEAGA